jgi:gamma-glutamylcyclotransferase (GGCT)/AIG2-like uncharacterized protein YtfP
MNNEILATNEGCERDPCTSSDYWYFAYGSNLCPEQMQTRLGVLFLADHSKTNLRPRLVRLPKHRVNFSVLGSDGGYYANIVPAQEDVLGVIYRCTSLALEKLDSYEVGYERNIMRVFDAEDQAFDAAVYIVGQENVSNAGSPHFEYLSKILQGGMHHGLPADYLRSIQVTAGLSMPKVVNTA